MEYFNTDSNNVATACKTWYTLFDAPTTLVVAQIFVYIAAHRYGVALTVIILFILVVQIFLDWKRAKYTILRYAHYQDRASMHLEFLQNFTSCKALGFEQMLFVKQTEIRKRENYYSRKGFIVQSIYTFLVNFTPEFTIFIIFVFDLAISGTDSSFDTKTVYTLISYIGLITGPLKNLPSAIINCVVGYISFERMEKLSKIE
jgi:ABC-type multidrug transport system fused ATPase/permease subunit